MAPSVDPHIHLWDVHDTPREVRPLVRLLGWNRALMQAVARRVFPRDLVEFVGAPTYVGADYLPGDFLGEAGPAGVERYVHIQAGWGGDGPLAPVGETEWLEGLRRAGATELAGIVGYADLALGAAVDVVLDAHREASDAFRGVRYMLATHPHPMVHDWAPSGELTLDPQWRRGFATLVEKDLCFDAWVYHHQLPAIAGLARDFPDARIVLCHAGTPVGAAGSFHGVGATDGERDRIRGQWRDHLMELASHDNVLCKISGLTMPVVGFGYHQRERPVDDAELADALAPYVRDCLAAFGPERCMFASNFPIEKVSVGYGALWSAFERIAERLELSEAARAALFRDTAVRFYRLDVSS